MQIGASGTTNPPARRLSANVDRLALCDNASAEQGAGEGSTICPDESSAYHRWEDFTHNRTVSHDVPASDDSFWNASRFGRAEAPDQGSAHEVARMSGAPFAGGVP